MNNQIKLIKKKASGVCLVKMDVSGIGTQAAGIGGKLIYWLGYGLLLAGVMGVIGFVYYVSNFKYKIFYWPVVGSVKSGVFHLDKPKKTRARWNARKTAWNILFKKKEIKPFEPENVYPGNNVFAFKLNEDFIPAEINFNLKAGEVKPIPYEVKNWAAMELKQNEIEFATKNFWDENKYFFMVIITAAICLAIVGVTVYYTYKFAAGGRIDTAAMNSLADTLKNFGSAVAPA